MGSTAEQLPQVPGLRSSRAYYVCVDTRGDAAKVHIVCADCVGPIQAAIDKATHAKR